jgi:hypothetical protein
MDIFKRIEFLYHSITILMVLSPVKDGDKKIN